VEEQRQAIELISSPVADAFSRAIRIETTLRDGGGLVRIPAANGHALDSLIERNGGFLAGPSRTLGVLCVRVAGTADIMGPRLRGPSARPPEWPT